MISQPVRRFRMWFEKDVKKQGLEN
jgi:hypothetical protein